MWISLYDDFSPSLSGSDVYEIPTSSCSRTFSSICTFLSTCALFEGSEFRISSSFLSISCSCSKYCILLMCCASWKERFWTWSKSLSCHYHHVLKGYLNQKSNIELFGNGVILFWRQRKISMFNNFETYKSMISDYAWFIFYRFSRVRVGRPKVGEGNGWTTCMFVKTFTKNQLLENGNVDEIVCWQKKMLFFHSFIYVRKDKIHNNFLSRNSTC